MSDEKLEERVDITAAFHIDDVCVCVCVWGGGGVGKPQGKKVLWRAGKFFL